MGLCTSGSETMSSTLKPGRALMHLRESFGDFGPGSILKSWLSANDDESARSNNPTRNRCKRGTSVRREIVFVDGNVLRCERKAEISRYSDYLCWQIALGSSPIYRLAANIARETINRLRLVVLIALLVAAKAVSRDVPRFASTWDQTFRSPAHRGSPL